MIKRIVNKKPDLIEDYYAHNIRLMPEFQKPIMGKDNALSYYKAFVERFETRQYDREEIEILDLGAGVVELGMFRINMKVKSTDKANQQKGLIVLVLQKKIYVQSTRHWEL